jgi:putative inorganic carbon (HCO3(-)) transporter
MDQKRQKLETQFNSIVVFFACLLIYFLPISIALTESMAGFVIFVGVIKKIVLNMYDCKQLRQPSFKDRLGIVLQSLTGPYPLLNRVMGFYLVIVLISVIHSEFVALSVVAFFGKVMEGYLLYFFIADCFVKKEHIRNFMMAYLLSTLLMGVNGITQYFTHTEFVRGTALTGGRVSSSLRHANDFGAYLLLPIPVILSLLLTPGGNLSWRQEWSSKQMGSSLVSKVFLGFLLVALVSCLGLTFSRGSWIGFVASLLLLPLLLRRFLVPVIAVGLIFFLFFMPMMIKIRDVSFTSDNVSLVQEYGSLPGDEESLKKYGEATRTRVHTAQSHYFGGMGRANYWNEALHVINEHPFMGSGLNSYSRVAKHGYPHNSFLQTAAETGIIGLFAFVLVLLTLFFHSCWRAFRMKESDVRMLLAGALAGWVSFLIQSFFDTTLYSVQLGSLMWISMGFMVALQHQPEPAEELTKKKGSI